MGFRRVFDCCVALLVFMAASHTVARATVP